MFFFMIFRFAIWEDNIRVDLREIGWEGVDWMHLAQDRDHYRALVNKLINLPSPYFLTSCMTIRFSNDTLLRGVSYLCFRLIYLHYQHRPGAD
jgi:hypothetical protein